MQSITADSSIEFIAEQTRHHVANNWESVLIKNSAKLSKSYLGLGDGAYGLYLDFLFKPIYRQLKDSGFRVLPKLPGNLNSSREWGNEAETDQQRWMWSVLKYADGRDCGTLVVAVFHDHTQFRLSQPPAIRFLTVANQPAIIAELSRIQSCKRYENGVC